MVLQVRIYSVLVAFFCLLWAFPGWADQDLEDKRRSLEQIRSKIQSTQRQLQQKKDAASSLERELKTVGAALDKINREIAELDRRNRTLLKNIEEKENETAAVRQRISALRETVRLRLIALYKGGEAGPMSMVFSSRSPARMAEEYDYMARVLENDQQLLADFRREIQQLKEASDKLAEARERQKKVLATMKENREVAREAATLKKRLLASARREEKSLDSELDELREQAKGLADLVKKLESKQHHAYTGTGEFASQKGQLPWPVKGAVNFGFGRQKHPELGTLFESHGMEIKAGSGQKVQAVADGRVIFANWFKGYGNLLIVDHGESYYTLYAQNSRLTKHVGDRVARGETLGYAGLAGSSGVYFEIRKGGTPQDPSAWLRRQ